MPTPRTVPDDLWVEIEPLIPPAPSRAKGGRPRASERHLLDAMLYIAVDGCTVARDAKAVRCVADGL